MRKRCHDLAEELVDPARRRRRHRQGVRPIRPLIPTPYLIYADRPRLRDEVRLPIGRWPMLMLRLWRSWIDLGGALARLLSSIR